MNVLTVVCVTLYTVILATAVAKIVTHPFLLNYVTIIVFFCLGCGFLITGLLMITAIKRYFSDFYNKVKTVLWIATMLLAVPMLIRSLNNAARVFIEPYESWYMENIMVTDAMNIVITTYFPVMAQMASMIFGAYNR